MTGVGSGASFSPLFGAATGKRVAVSPCACSTTPAAAELTHWFDACPPRLLGQALPIDTTSRFDSPRRLPRPCLRSSGTSQGAPKAAPAPASDCTR